MDGNFLPTRLQRPTHVELSAELRGVLHLWLNAAHRAVRRGRDDVAVLMIRSAARVCARVEAKPA